MTLSSHARFPYRSVREPIASAWPNGSELAVYLGVNLEHFAFGEGLGAAPAPSGQPDVLRHAWRDYGNRAGASRLIDLLDDLSLPATALVNSAIRDCFPDYVRS